MGRMSLKEEIGISCSTFYTVAMKEEYEELRKLLHEAAAVRLEPGPPVIQGRSLGRSLTSMSSNLGWYEAQCFGIAHAEGSSDM